MRFTMVSAPAGHVSSWLYHPLIYVMVFLPSLSHALTHCPPHDDVNRAVHHCLRDYTTHLQNIQRTESHFFAGVDVETLRTLCSHFKTSMLCVTSLQNACPESHHHVIDVALRPYIAMFDMCYTHKTFIEDYAMSQNCLYNQRDQSDDCFKQFLINTANHQYHASRDRQSAVNSYCRSLSELTNCVRLNIMHRCRSTTAARLVDILVPLSTELSYKCTVFSSHSSDTRVTSSAGHRDELDAAAVPSAARVSSQHLPATICVTLVTCTFILLQKLQHLTIYRAG